MLCMQVQHVFAGMTVHDRELRHCCQDHDREQGKLPMYSTTVGSLHRTMETGCNFMTHTHHITYNIYRIIAYLVTRYCWDMLTQMSLDHASKEANWV